MNRSDAGKLGAAKSKETWAKKVEKAREEYLLNPTLCNFCSNPLTYERKRDKFCNRSCSAKYNNLGVRRHPLKESLPCIYCGEPLPKQRTKFCSNDCLKANRASQVKEEITKEANAKEKVLVSPRAIRAHLIETLGAKCQRCGWCEVNPTSGKVPIELEHIDGNSQNNHISNLTLLCPNCHSLTSTYKALNKGNGRHSRRQRYKEGKSF